MYEVEFQRVGEGERSGDAITVRFTDPSTSGWVIGVIDAGFAENGEAVVDHVQTYYGTSSVDFVLSTHPDGDHINGMGVVMRSLNVGNLLIHRPAQHGYPKNSGARPAEELVQLAEEQGAKVIEPFTGVDGFGGAFVVAGPTEAYYEQMLAEQEITQKAAARKPTVAQRYFGEAAVQKVRKLAERALTNFPIELDFDDAGGDNPRNNSSAITSLMVDGKHILLPSDAGVPAISQALDYLDWRRPATNSPAMLALPHHGSRHNLDLDTIKRLVGAGHTSNRQGIAIASVSTESELPSPRVANAFGRRGYPVFPTNRGGLAYLRWASDDAPPRAGLVPSEPLPPLSEDDHD